MWGQRKIEFTFFNYSSIVVSILALSIPTSHLVPLGENRRRAIKEHL